MPFPRAHSPVGRRWRQGHWARWSGGAVLILTLVMLGPLVVAGQPTASAASPRSTTTQVSAYWLVAADGGIFAFGGAPFYGSMGGHALNRPVVGMAGVPSGGGYWEVASDGGIFSFGDAHFHGSTGNITLNKPVVGMAATPDGNGYWLVASDGGIFSFGDAHFHGSTGNITLNKPVVGMAATPDGNGYWLVASDGGVFAFGDAHFYGSTGNIILNQPIVGMAVAPHGLGYWFTAADGGVFAFGDAPFYGSLGDIPQSRPVVAMTASADGRGYWFTNSNGAVTAYGDATYWGSAPQVIAQPVVGMAQVDATGNFSGSSYPSGTYGYDISNYQCGDLPPSPHTIGIVQVVGVSMGATNPCLASEAAWAGGGLNLYMYLTFGAAGHSSDGSCDNTASPDACNYGFLAAQDAFAQARAAGVNTSVAWWLDVEPDVPGLPAWSTNLAANAALVQGALDGLHAEGINSAGIYASPGNWNGIVGGYQPEVPYWAADWDISPATTCANVRRVFGGALLPAGPIQIIQYSSPSFPLEAGGMNTAFDNDYAC